jgi:hypothetical protein
VSPEVGESFAGYRIDGVLGRGGMGVVFRAWQERLQRAVALKVLPPGLAADAEYRARFGREATALTSLDSPHVVHVYDHGEAGGSLYLAMQLVEGSDLAALLADGPLPPRRAVTIVEQVAAALGDAHAIGVVHRDVKPGNVLVRGAADTTDDVFAYLCDFGIARSVADVGSGPDTAGLIGTLGYMAPERFRGEPATPASDVYALGCLLWAALTGGPPFTGTQAAVILAHVEGAIPRLDGTDARTVALNALLAGMLAKDPVHRPSTGEIRAALRAVLARTTSRPLPVPRRAAPRRRLLVGGGIAVVVGAAAVTGAVALFGGAGDPDGRIGRSTPRGVTCSSVAVGPGSGAQAEVVCDAGAEVGRLRIVALDGAGAAPGYLRTGVGQDLAALPDGTCPADLPARQAWARDGHGGTVLCLVRGTTTRYVWTDDAQATVSVLDGRADAPYPTDLDAVDAFFDAVRFG